MFGSGRRVVSVVWLWMIVLSGAPAGAQTPAPAAATGRIAGTVSVKGEGPAQAASVMVLGTRLGAAADEHGRFVIVGVPVGTWSVLVQLMGYAPVRQTVAVDAGATRALSIFLAPKIVDIPEIVVIAKRSIDPKTSATSHVIPADVIRLIPVDDLNGMVGLKAGVVVGADGIHIRGGRVGEVKTLKDGIEANDPLTTTAPSVPLMSIASAEILSGGLDAEDGGALSGLIHVSSREGGDHFGGELRWDTDRYGDATKTFDNFDRIALGFGGPSPIENLTYFATYEGTFTDTYLRSSFSRPRRTLLDFIQLGNRQNNDINTNLKLAWRLSPERKVTFEAANNRSVRHPYDHMWSRQGYVQVALDTVRVPGQGDALTPRYGGWSATQADSTWQPVNMPDHYPTLDSRFQQETVVMTQTLASHTTWVSRASLLRFQSLFAVGRKKPWEYEVQSPFYWSGNTQAGTENNPYFATHGDFPQYAESDQTVWALKSDLATTRWKTHRAKTGVSLRYNRVRNLSLLLPNAESNGLPGAVRSDFLNFNPEGAAYVQDRWEFEGLVLNAGVRFDAFTPGDQIPNEDLRSGRRYKQQLSPRLGIAYPISDKDALSFHYGWTYQTPARNFVFQNRGTSAAVNVRGNPDLEPETNIAYQAAIQHLFSRDVSGQFAVFFKDIYGLITVRQERDAFGNLVNMYFNGDYASSRGFEASVAKSFSHKFSAEVNYTYSLATGVASNPNQALQFFNGGQLYLPISEQPLTFDQRHTLSLQTVVRNPGKWGFRMLWLYGSGFPFTPSYRNDRRPDPVLNNSRRLPSSARLTIDGDKYYRVWGQNVTLFFDARNVLNARNIAALTLNPIVNPFVNTAGDDYTIYYTETGRAGGGYLQDTNGDNVADWVPVNDPRVFEEGRHVRVGVSVVF